jgi:hypothetical protein
MISAGAFVTLIEYPGSPVQQAIADPDIRRALIGLAMGLTANGIIYSPWGQRSGAHINPSVILTFLRLGVEIYQRVRPRPIVKCAKLDHPAHVRCIHCGYQPPGASKA